MYGNIFYRKCRLIGELKKVQNVLDVHCTERHKKCEAILRSEIEEVLGGAFMVPEIQG